MEIYLPAHYRGDAEVQERNAQPVLLSNDIVYMPLKTLQIYSPVVAKARFTQRDGLPTLRMSVGYRPGVIRDQVLSAKAAALVKASGYVVRPRAWSAGRWAQWTTHAPRTRQSTDPQAPLSVGRRFALGVKFACYGERMGRPNFFSHGHRAVIVSAEQLLAGAAHMRALYNLVSSPYCHDAALASWRQCDLQVVTQRRLHAEVNLLRDLGFYYWHFGEIAAAHSCFRLGLECARAFIKRSSPETPTAHQRDMQFDIPTMHEVLGDLALEEGNFGAADKYYRTARGTLASLQDALQELSLREQAEFIGMSFLVPGALGAGMSRAAEFLQEKKAIADGRVRIEAKERMLL